MRFRVLDKREKKAYSDTEYLLNHKGELFMELIDNGRSILCHAPTVFFEVQYSTGLTDVNGVEIFEGDWVCWADFYGRTHEAQVVFSPKVASFVLDTSGRHLIDDKYGDYQTMHYQEKYKIIEKP